MWVCGLMVSGVCGRQREAGPRRGRIRCDWARRILRRGRIGRRHNGIRRRVRRRVLHRTRRVRNELGLVAGCEVLRNFWTSAGLLGRSNGLSLIAGTSNRCTLASPGAGAQTPWMNGVQLGIASRKDSSRLLGLDTEGATFMVRSMQA